MTRPYFLLAVLALIIGATLIAAYFGACANLVAGDNGGKGNVVGLAFGIVFLVAAGYAWRARKGPMR